MAESAVTSFKSTLDSLAEETGYNYQLLHPDFKKVLSNKRINACWFAPGTIMASIEAEGNVIIIEVAGQLRADIFDPDGGLAKSFQGSLEVIQEESGLRLISDSDLNALVSESGYNGYHMEVYSRNVVRAYLEKYPDIFVDAQHPSVARAIVNKGLIEELLSMVPSEAGETAGNSIVDPVDIGELPDVADVLPEVFEETLPAEEPAQEQPKEKKKTKKTAKASSKKEAKDEEKSDVPRRGRYDLLPLDLIGLFIEEFDAADADINFFDVLEACKTSQGNLLDAALSLAKGYFTDSVAAVMEFAVIAEKDAEENGEDTWKACDVRYFINEAVRYYLLYLREGNASGYISKAVWSLVCGAWVARTR